jgi:hypothetical protein
MMPNIFMIASRLVCRHCRPARTSALGRTDGIDAESHYIGRRVREHPGSWASGEERPRFLAAVPTYHWAFMGRTTPRDCLSQGPPPRRILARGGALGKPISGSIRADLVA